MKRLAALAAGALLVIVGIIWTLQGLGYLPGSVMTGVTMWAVSGPVVALAGGLLIVWSSRRSRPGSGQQPDERRCR